MLHPRHGALRKPENAYRALALFGTARPIKTSFRLLSPTYALLFLLLVRILMGMRVAIVIPQRGFKDESLSIVKEMLDKWHVEPVVASYFSGDCVGYHGAVIKPDQNAALVKYSDFDALLLIDGPGIDQYKLFDFRTLLDTVKLFNSNGKIVGAIGNAVKIIARANIVANTRIAAPRDDETKRLAVLFRAILTDASLEFDRNVLTTGDPQQAGRFSIMLLKELGIE